MSRHDERSWRDRIAFGYIEAVDAGDSGTIADFWEQAESDPELEVLLRELDEGLADEEGDPDSRDADSAIVLDLARRHLQGGFTSADEEGPIRAADVAARLRADPELWRKLDDQDRRSNERFLTSTAPLPDRLGPPRLARWGEGLGISARLQYWDAFHKVAVRLRMGAGPSRGHRAAARPIDPRVRTQGDRHEPEQ